MINPFLSQRIFRLTLEAMAFPGKVVGLPQMKTSPDETPASYPLLLLLTFLDAYVGFNIVDKGQSPLIRKTSEYLTIHGGCKEVPISEADFVLALGGSTGGEVEKMKRGSLEYPDQGATLVYQVEEIGKGIPLRLTGPGILHERILKMEGIDQQEIDIWEEVNADFPLGVDMIFCDRNGALACLPRSTRVRC